MKGDASAPADQDGPRYVRIQRTLEERVSAGAYPIGTLMPTEAELSREFGTSRFTIREALRHLTERGFVERRAGIGTRVVSEHGRDVFSQSYTSLEELFQVAVETFFVTNAVEPVVLTEDVAQRVGGAAGERWSRISGVRWTEPGGRPVCYIHSYVPERFEAVVPSLIGQQRPFFAGLEEHAGERIEEVVQEISTTVMPKPMQRALGLRPDALALVLLRRYHTATGVLIASFNWHPSDQMRYVIRIQRGRQPSP